MNILTNSQKTKIFGKPGDQSNLVVIQTPFPIYLDWAISDLRKKLKEQGKELTAEHLKTIASNKILCHKIVAPYLKKILDEILSTYGFQKIRELGIDEFAGCFNMRPMRGYEQKYMDALEAGNLELAFSYLSSHSWAIALDWDADRNTLKETARTARFARPEYKAMIDIYYKHGFISYLREKNYDGMHFEAGTYFMKYSF